MPKTKTCTGCQKRKPISEYYRAQGTRDGLYRRCKACCAVLRRRRYLENRQQALDHQREYDATHKEQRKKYRETHKKEIRAYYQRNKGRILERARKYREAKEVLEVSG